MIGCIHKTKSKTEVFLKVLEKNGGHGLLKQKLCNTCYTKLKRVITYSTEESEEWLNSHGPISSLIIGGSYLMKG